MSPIADTLPIVVFHPIIPCPVSPLMSLQSLFTFTFALALALKSQLGRRD
ncbi:hypothetical protein M405DRAFT_859822 [Rhizopogon salebrosus TDB-379]|nr:hypothetical protein M405DRAFT_859822 [Rhizopogon salebrosus TDB-379]